MANAALHRPVPPERHLCCLCETKDEQFAHLLPFLAEGLEQHEKVIYLAAVRSGEAAIDRLRDQGVDVDAPLGSGQLIHAIDRDSYTRQGGFDPERMIAFLDDQVAGALAANYAGLRVAGEMAWVMQTLADADAVLQLEARLTAFLPDQPCCTLFLYDRAAFDAAVLLNAYLSYPEIGVGAATYANPAYVPANELLAGDRPAAMLEHWLARLPDRQAETQELQRQARLFEALVDDCSDLIARLDSDGVVRYKNVSVQRVLGYEPDEWVGQSMLQLVHPDDVPAVERALADVAADPAANPALEFRARHKDGSWRTLEATFAHGARLHSEAAVEDGVVLSARDVTERERMQAELDRARKQLILLREAEWLELAQTLHDGPIQEIFGVMLRLGALSSEMTDETVVARLAGIRATLQHASNTLREVFARLRPSALTAFGLEGALFSHARHLRSVQPGLEVEHEFQTSGRELPVALQLILFRVAEELLQNVIEHAGADHVSIRFETDAEQGQIRLAIEDDGIGFEVPAQLFEFVRSGRFGLWEARTRIEALDGDLAITSSPDGGTTVTVRLPQSSVSVKPDQG